VEQGADMVELDVRLAAGGVPVVIHDLVVGADQGRRRRVGRLSPEELKRCGPPGFCPTLSEVLEALKGRIALNVEIKELHAVRPALEAVREAGMEKDVLVSSFEAAAVELAARELPSAERALLVRSVGPSAEALLARLGARSLHVAGRAFRTQQVERMHRAGLALAVFTVDEPSELRRLQAAGVDAVFTNRPDLALQVCQ
jgi:glycerophosphoryl diester phosphodiesterase